VDPAFLVIIALFVLFWVLLIRPQRRRQRAQDEMVTNLRLGDEIVTAGGLYGEITRLDEDELTVEIAEGVEVRVARRAVAGVMPEEDDEELDDEEEPEAEAASKTDDES
jgi:preprotein translocase subunit YajC